MKTDAQKELEGTLRNDRKKGESNIKDLMLNRVQPLPSFIQDNITDKQHEIYKHTLRLLIDAKVVTKLDLMIVVQYAVAIDLYLKATEELNRKKMVQVFHKTGASNVSGYLTAWKQTGEVVTKLEKLLGLNPYIRERIAAYAKQSGIEEVSPFDALMKEMNSIKAE